MDTDPATPDRSDQAAPAPDPITGGDTVTRARHDTVLVVDYGAQYAQLIARRVRESDVYSEVVPHTMGTAELLARDPAAIVLSGGPSSVYAVDAPGVDPALFDAGVPVLGICYGFQAMAQSLGPVADEIGRAHV